MLLKSLLKQLRLWVFFGAIWHLHLGIHLGSCIPNIGSSSARICSSYLHPYNETETKKGGESAEDSSQLGMQGGRWHNTSSVNDMLDELDWPSLEDPRLKSSLTFFYKIHSGTVSLDKDKYLTPAPRLRYTRTSHDSQYTRHMSYSDARKNSFFPRTIPLWNSLPSSMVAFKTTEEFKALI